MKKFCKNEKGFISIYAILWMAVLVPFLFFITIDVTHYVHQHVHLKSVTDNASASAVTALKEDLIPSGIIEVDEEEAKRIALNIIKTDLLLNDDLTPKEGSPLTEAPKIEIKVANVSTEEGYDVPISAGSVTIYEPSVVIYAEYSVGGLFYNKSSVVLNKLGVSQARFASNH